MDPLVDSSTSTGNEPLKFVPFSSCVNPSFWFELNRVKLDVYKLNDDFKSLNGHFNNSIKYFEFY
jgi:hypothetical protein